MSDLSAATKKLNTALARLENAASSAGVSQNDMAVLVSECDSLRAQNRALEEEVGRLRGDNSTLAERNDAAAGHIDAIIGTLEGVLSEQPA